MSTLRKKIISLWLSALLLMGTLSAYQDYSSITLNTQQSHNASQLEALRLEQGGFGAYRLRPITPCSSKAASYKKRADLFARAPDPSFQQFIQLELLACRAYRVEARKDPKYRKFIRWLAAELKEDKHIQVEGFDYKYKIFGTSKNDLVSTVNEEVIECDKVERAEQLEEAQRLKQQRQNELALKVQQEAMQREHALIKQTQMQEHERQVLLMQEQQRNAPRMAIAENAVPQIVSQLLEDKPVSTSYYYQRAQALEETLRTKAACTDYSVDVPLPQDVGENVEVFQYCYGTPLDKQLHQELCQTRTAITNLHSEYPALTPVKTITPVVYHFTALAKVQTNPTIAFNLADCCHHVTQGLRTLASGVGQGVINTFEHNVAFFTSLATHPIDEVIKPFCQAGVALGNALYQATELAITNPAGFGEKAITGIAKFVAYVADDPELAIAGATELLFSVGSGKLGKLKPVQSMAGFIYENAVLKNALKYTHNAVAKCINPLQEVFNEASLVLARSLERGNELLRNICRVAENEVELVGAGNIAMSKIDPNYALNTANKKAAKAATAFRESICVKTLADKIRNVGDDILDVMEKAGGHTLSKHVSKTESYLRYRILNNDISATSSFTCKRIAIKSIQENMRNNADAIAIWLKTSSLKEQKAFDFIHRYEIGMGVLKGKNKLFLNLTKSKIILEPDPFLEFGFKIITAFPIIK
jgi:hypothetical protein